MIVRQILIDRADDPVAIDVRKRIAPLLFKDVAFGVGVARDVEPEAAPAFAVARRGQQAVQHFGVGLRRFVGEERVYFIGVGRQTGQVERGAPDQRALVGGRVGFNAFGFEFRTHEAVDGRQRGMVFFQNWNGRSHGLFERPKIFGFVRIGRERSDFSSRIGRAHADPSLDIGDLMFVKLFVGRHLKFFVFVTHGFDDQAFLDFARHHGGPGCASFKSGRARIEQQRAFDFFSFDAVAGVAFRDQQRPDFALEEFDAFVCRLRREHGRRGVKKNHGKGRCKKCCAKHNHAVVYPMQWARSPAVFKNILPQTSRN